MRVLAVDPGEKRIGIAVSDETGTLARPLTVLPHHNRAADAAAIARLVAEQQAGLVVVGQALDDEGLPSLSGRKAARLAEVLSGLTAAPVVLWDESGSTDAAYAVRLRMGAGRRDRRGHLDDVAAAVILQSYLDAQRRIHPVDPGEP